MSNAAPTPMNWERAVETLRSDPEQRSLVRACYYDDPLRDAAIRFQNSEEWRAVMCLLKQITPGRVLDIGAGRGISSFAFLNAGWDVAAIEPDPSNIVGAGAIRSLCEGSDIELRQEWGESLPFDDESFDLVYGRAVLHHAKDLVQFCREAARVLRPQGMFLMTREHVISSRNDLVTFLDSHPLHRLYGGEAAYLLKEYADAIENGGLRVTKAIGPASSPINYFPASRQDHSMAMAQLVADRFGICRSLAIKFALKVPGAIRLIELLHDARNNTPGRLYTFVATKP